MLFYDPNLRRKTTRVKAFDLFPKQFVSYFYTVFRNNLKAKYKEKAAILKEKEHRIKEKEKQE